MAGIRRSARLVDVIAKCGHVVMVRIPPGEMGAAGRRDMAEAKSNPCYTCQKSK